MQLTEQQRFIRDCLGNKNKPVRTDRLAKELGVTDHAQFIHDLNALERAGEIIISKKNNIQSVRGAGFIKGQIISFSRGFCFMKPDNGGKDVFISSSDSMGALPGDRVVISLHADEKGDFGRIKSVYEHGPRTAVGTVRRFHGKLELHADAFYTSPIEIVKNKIDAHEGDKILVKVRFSPDGKKLTCAAEKMYGDAECAKVCADAIIDALGIPHEFDEVVRGDAKTINAAGVREDDLKGRTDLRGWNIFTIDGADAKDLDDAIFVRRIKGGYELSVHIADVSHYVTDESPLDQEALRRGTSSIFSGAAGSRGLPRTGNRKPAKEANRFDFRYHHRSVHAGTLLYSQARPPAENYSVDGYDCLYLSRHQSLLYGRHYRTCFSVNRSLPHSGQNVFQGT